MDAAETGNLPGSVSPGSVSSVTLKPLPPPIVPQAPKIVNMDPEEVVHAKQINDDDDRPERRNSVFSATERRNSAFTGSPTWAKGPVDPLFARVFDDDAEEDENVNLAGTSSAETSETPDPTLLTKQRSFLSATSFLSTTKISPVNQESSSRNTATRFRGAAKKAATLGTAFKFPEKKETASPKKKFEPSRVLQRAARKAAVHRVFRAQIITSFKTDALGYSKQRNSDPFAILQTLLSSDTSSRELAELVFDAKKLKQVASSILKANKTEKAREEKEEVKRREAEAKAKMAERRNACASSSTALFENQGQINLDTLSPRENNNLFPPVHDEESLRKTLGFGMTKDEFFKMVDDQSPQEANQIIVARLMQVLATATGHDDETPLSFLRFYSCIDPNGTFMTLWMIVFITFLVWITTVGLVISTFDLDVLNSCTSWSTYNWIDFSIDGFFVADIIGRCFFFGQEGQRLGIWDRHTDLILEPDRVFLNYVKGGFIVDVLTGFPVQWVIMSLYTPCETRDKIGLFRLIRVIRLTRVFKIFNTPQIRKWARQFRRHVGNNYTVQLVRLFSFVVLVTHVWTCVGWIVFSLDTSDDDGDGLTGFEEWKIQLRIPHMEPEDLQTQWFRVYCLVYSVTIKNLCAIENYFSNQTVEAVYGIITIFLSVFINATMLANILEVW